MPAGPAVVRVFRDGGRPTFTRGHALARESPTDWGSGVIAMRDSHWRAVKSEGGAAPPSPVHVSPLHRFLAFALLRLLAGA
ncbi:hypothetical protein GCM10012319_21460 [Comamonas sp. KCTC 72670]|nr:hypothetical protein GCM10012319_21460 [Comamonas sp. KCTC 72670]